MRAIDTSWTFLIERFITASTARNTIAHHLWGTQAELPDALLFMEPSAMRLSTVELRVAAALPDERAKLERMTALLDRIRKMSTVWVEQDFLDATARLRRLQVVAITFGIVIAPDGDPIESANARRIILDKNAEAAEFVRRREEKEA